MHKTTVYNFLKENHDKLFPNKKYTELQVEDAMVSASDIFGNYLNGSLFKDSSTAFLLTLILGIWGVGMFYIGEIKRGVLRLLLLVLPSLITVPYGLIAGIKNGGDMDPSNMLNSPGLIFMLIGYVIFFIVTLLIDLVQIKELCRRNNCKKIIQLAAKYYQPGSNRYKTDPLAISVDDNELDEDEADDKAADLDLDALSSDFKG